MRQKLLTIIVAFAAVIISARDPLEAQGYHRGANYFPNLPVVTQDGKVLNFYDDVIKDKIESIKQKYQDQTDDIQVQIDKVKQSYTDQQDAIQEKIDDITDAQKAQLDPLEDQLDILKKVNDALRARQDVAIQNDKVRQLARFERALLFFLEGQIGIVGGFEVPADRQVME